MIILGALLRRVLGAGEDGRRKSEYFIIYLYSYYKP